MAAASPPVPPAAPKPTPRRRFRPWRIFGYLVFVVVALVAGLPYLVNFGFVHRRIEASMSDALGTQVKVKDLGFSWFSGVSLEGLEIQNAPGFDRSHPFLSLRSMRGDIAFLQLARMRFGLSGAIDGLVVHVDQDAAGRSNVEALFGGAIQIEPGEVQIGVSDPSDDLDLASLRLHLGLTDGMVEIRRNGQVIESARNLSCTLAKEFGTQVVRVDLSADLHRPDQPEHPGRLALRADVNAQTQVVDSQLTAAGLDLSRYRPLVSAFLKPGDLTALQGIVNGTVKAIASAPEGGQQLFLEGTLSVEAPRLAGALLQGMDVQAAKWTVSPNLQVKLGRPGELPTVVADRFAVDLGFATARGLTGAELAETLAGKTGLGLEYTLDLDAIAAFGGPIPEPLRRTGGRVQGRLALPIEGGKMPDFSKLQELVRTDAQLTAQRIAVAGFEVAQLDSTMTVQDGSLRLKTGGTTLLNTGAFALDLGADLKDLGRLPFEFSLQWTAGRVDGDTANLLRYALPLLAGLDQGANFQGAIDLGLELQGPALKATGENWLQFFNAWTGKGNVNLNGASLAPSEALQGLLSAVGGGDGKLAIDRLAGGFSLRNGGVQSQLLKWESRSREYYLEGTTRLDGGMDWRLDLTSLLNEHKDGAKIAAALGSQKLTAGLKGTLDAPKLAMPDLGGLIQSGLQNAAEELLRKKASELLPKLPGGELLPIPKLPGGILPKPPGGEPQRPPPGGG